MQSIDNLFNCECCGGRLIEIENKKYKCDHCGQIRYIETTASTQVISMLNQANILRNKGEFDDAFDIFNDILSIESDNADAYWGMFLCSYGIMHVQDPSTNKYVPTCNRCSEISIEDNSSYKKALQFATSNQANIFTQAAQQIESIRIKTLLNSHKEKPYDIFICYKRTISMINGREVYTEDSVCARDIYDMLTAKGYKVFFAEKTLQNLAGSEYEPIIYNAIKTSKLMLVVSSDPEFINSPWVKNEWRRFIKQMEFDSSKKLIPILFNGMKATSLPDKLKKYQALEINATFQSNLLNIVESTLNKEKSEPQPIKQVVSPKKEKTKQDNKSIKKEIKSFESKKNKIATKATIIITISLVFVAMFSSILIYIYSFSKPSSPPSGDNEKQEQQEVINDNFILANKYKNNKFLTSITIDSNTTTIQQNAFSGCTNLESITFAPNSKLEIISDSVFSGCTKLTAITLPNSLKHLGSYVFKNCESLKSVSFEDNSALTSLNYGSFENCTSLETINLPVSIESIGYDCFKNCSRLEKITIPKNTTVLKSYSFSKCSSLETVNFEQDSKLTTIYDNAFEYCTSLKSITLPDSLNSLGNYVFSDCLNLNKINISKQSNLATIGSHAFSGCKKLYSILLPSLLTTLSEQAFSGCTKLVEIVNLSNCTLTIEVYKNALNITKNPNYTSEISSKDGVYYYRAIAFDCEDNLEYLTLSSDCILITKNAFNSKQKLLSAYIPDSITEIEDYAFYNCENLTTIRLSKNIQTLQTFTLGNCTRLIEIINPANISLDNINLSPSIIVKTTDNTYTSKIETRNNVRYYIDGDNFIAVSLYNKSLKNVILDNSCTEINTNAFKNEQIENVIISTTIKTIKNNAFFNCKKLMQVDIAPNSTLKTIETEAFYNTIIQELRLPTTLIHIEKDAFKSCAYLTNVYLDSDNRWVYKADKSATNLTNISAGDIENSATLAQLLTKFYVDKYWEKFTIIKTSQYKNNSDLTTITIPKDVGYILSEAFSNCTNLESVIFEEGSRLIEIQDKAFYNCINLKTIILPEKVEKIGAAAFYNCINLRSINIPSKITTINEETFKKCNKLNNIKFETNSQLKEINDQAFYNCHSLTSFEIQPQVNTIKGFAFFGCYRLVELNNISNLNLSPGNINYGEIARYVLKINKTNNFISNLTWENGIEYYKYDNTTKYAVNCDTNLSSITLADDCTIINNHAFYNHTNLRSAYIKNKVTTIDNYAFYNCYNLTTIKTESNPTATSSSFEECYKLVEIINLSNEKLSGFITIKTLIETTDPNYTSKITQSNNVLYFTDNGVKTALGCIDPKVENVVLANDTNIINHYAFAFSEITSINIPENVSKINTYAFYGCSLLNEINFEIKTGWKKDGIVSVNSDLVNAYDAAYYMTSNYSSTLEK